MKNKLVLFFTIIEILGFQKALADLAIPPEQVLENEKIWNEAKCSDPKNLIQCKGDRYVSKNNMCLQYQNNPKRYKWLAANGSHFYVEKYCKRIGKDK
jgi:hypothetical protein